MFWKPPDHWCPEHGAKRHRRVEKLWANYGAQAAAHMVLPQAPIISARDPSLLLKRRCWPRTTWLMRALLLLFFDLRPVGTQL
mmetsp:Transcript_12290/g.33763  ORF Transcript_12290/g.33763 Transcript_12290/m.33763 type:complete len:83 (+) Transcript_12290:200-448(+)